MQLISASESSLASSATVISLDSDSPSLSISADPEAKQVLLTVTPPVKPQSTLLKDASKRAALDICCVIDVSGSMATEALMPADPSTGTPAESAGLSVLDVVKHALRTIISTTREDDRIALVSFSDRASVAAGLTEMTESGRKQVLQAIHGLRPDSCTNLWDGLKVGMDLFTAESEAKPFSSALSPSGRLSTVFLLTDGMPNIVPPRGHIPVLKAYLDANTSSRPFSISTFGFGYQLDTDLMVEIAQVGGGAYGFIPDSGMVGTVFVNAVANAYATYAPRMTIDVEIPPDCTFVVKGNLPVIKTTWGAKIQAGDLQYGQSLDYVLEFPDKFTYDVVATATYQAYTSSEPRKLQANLHPNASDNLPASRYHAARLKFVEILSSKLELSAAIDALNALHKEITTSPVLVHHSDALALATDVSGEGILAHKTKNFQRWGRHYLPSLARFHQRQQCGNFKDPGLQVYGSNSPVFKGERDKLDDAFMALPPPTPSLVPRSNRRSPGGPAPPRKKLTSMSWWNNASGPCFAGNCLVKLSTGENLKVEDLKRGMEVQTMRGPNKVAAVVQTAVPDGEMLLCRIGDLKVTPWHPIVSPLQKDTWVFPTHVTPPEPTACDAVYSVLLSASRDADAHTVSIAGIWCVTLGHGLTNSTNPDVRSHAFLGDYEKVLADLSRLDDFFRNDGRVRCVGTRRNVNDGTICGFVGDSRSKGEYDVEKRFLKPVHV